jgi:hypothetical protein
MDADERVLEAWKTTVGVQQHFNDLEMRIRSVAITVLGAFLAAAGFSMKEKLQLEIFGRPLSLTGFILLAAAICWMLFYLMDRHWYHRLLRGAVTHGLSIEKRAKAAWPDLGLTTAISKASPIILPARRFGPFKWKRRALGTDFKMAMFYRSIGLLLIGGAIATFIDRPPQGSRAEAAISIDAWWMIDFARNSCQASRSCGADPANPGKVLQYIDTLKEEFAASPSCLGVSIFDYRGPKSQNPQEPKDKETLIIDYQPNAAVQRFSITGQPSNGISGSGTVNDIVNRTCVAARGLGGRIQ